LRIDRFSFGYSAPLFKVNGKVIIFLEGGDYAKPKLWETRQIVYLKKVLYISQGQQINLE